MEWHVRAPFLSAAARPSVVLAVLLGGFGARLVCCTSLRLSLRKCSLTRRLWRWDAPRPVSLTRGFKGHTPFIRPVFETASAASCLCHQVRLGLLSGWTMNTWSRFARQKEERTSSALIAAALHSAPAELPADFCRQVCRVREAGWWLVRARNTTTDNSTTALSSSTSLAPTSISSSAPTSWLLSTLRLPPRGPRTT